IRSRADDKGLVLILDFDKNIPKFLNGDEIRIKQIITNILTNAVKYTEKGSIIFSVTYKKSDINDDSIMLEVAVKDTGIGIKSKDIKKLFIEFERIDEKKNRSIEGTGLGLTITKKLLEMMNSSLYVDSAYGVGSKFYFSLEQKVVKWDILGDYEASYRESIARNNNYEEKFTAPDAKILVVDDNPLNLMVIKNLLKQTLVKIETAGSGDEGIKLTRGKKYDIILMDHMMPEKDGIETFHEMREQKDNMNINTPVICLTANAVSGARDRYIAEGFDDYITKPIDSLKLEDLLLKYLPENKIKSDNTNTSDNYEEIIPQSIKDIEELDIKLGINNNGSEEAYVEMLKVYANMADRYIEEIKGYMVSDDIKNATIKIHALKSTARIIGAYDIGELAQKLEHAGQENDIETLKSEIGGLLERCSNIGKQLTEIFKEENDNEADNNSRPIISEERINEEYERIKEFSWDCDSAGIEDILEEIVKYRIPESEKMKYNDILLAFDDFDFGEIVDILS
ncbi:MAG: response regulator, partial [Firmicutes bacterium]|nr:response regulator [Bacillota bacterium]